MSGGVYGRCNSHAGLMVCMWARYFTRGPDRWRPGPFPAHVNPIGGCVGGLPTMPPMGFSCA